MIKTAIIKEYLRHAEVWDSDLERLRRQILTLKSTLLPRAISYEGDNVQTSAGDPMAETFAKIDELERQIGAYALRRMELRTQIIGQLCRLPEKESRILYLRYVDGKRLRTIARDLAYSEYYVRHLHGEALRLFGETYEKEISSWMAKS